MPPRKPSTRSRKTGAPTLKDSETPTAEPGPNLIAALSTIDALRASGRIEPVDTARVTALLSIAARLDEAPHDAAMWAQYRLAEASLREVHDDDTDELSELVAAMSATVGDEADAKPKNARPRNRSRG